MALVGTALGLLVAALVLALAPLHGPGVEGTPVEPRYGRFSYAVFGVLPEEPSQDDLRSAGVVLPTDTVAQRRQSAYAAAGLSAVLALAGVVRVSRAGRPPGRTGRTRTRA